MTNTAAETYEYLTPSDAARVLVMSADNVRRLTKTGVISPALVVGSRKIALYRRADIEALARKRARPQRTPIPTERRKAAK